MAFHTTDPQYVNPFGSTAEDMRNMYARVEAAMSRARGRLAKIPRPGSYWEEPEIHGSGRQINLRGARGKLSDLTRKPAPRKLRLPPMPRKHFNAGHALLLGTVVVGVGAIAWLLYDRHKRKAAAGVTQVPQIAPAHVGDGYAVLLGDA